VQTQPAPPCNQSTECMASNVLHHIASMYPPINPPPGCIWDKATGEAACCPICLGDLTSPGHANEPLQRIGCDHIFHYDCLCEWFERQWQKRGMVSCPVCRAQVCAARHDDEEEALDLEYQRIQQMEQRQQLEYRMLNGGHAHLHRHQHPGLSMANVVPSR
jgi:hypothetical protein